MPCNECLTCLNEITKKAISLSTDDDTEQKILYEKISNFIKKSFPEIRLPDFSTTIFAMIAEETGVSDPFLAIKQESNRQFKQIIPKITNSLENLEIKEIIYRLFLYSIGANMVDFSTGGHSVNIQEIVNNILDFPTEGLAINDFEKIYENITRVKKIIFLSDNCGEVVIDNLLVKYIMDYLGKDVYLGLKENPVANDCSLKDFERDNLPFYATETFVVSSSFGYNLHQTTKRFKELLEKSKLLIAKGQSNYETTLNNLSRYPTYQFPNIFCVLRTKCQIIANHLGAPLGSNIIKQMYPYNTEKKITEIVECE